MVLVHVLARVIVHLIGFAMALKDLWRWSSKHIF